MHREQIVAAALGLIDASGLEKFSIRELARSLDVYPTSIYWHVRGGRNELLAAACGLALTDVTPKLSLGDDWRAWIRSLFRRYRAALARHPNVAPLLGAQLVSNAGVSPTLVDRLLNVLASAGFEGPDLVSAYNATFAALLGYATLEFAPPPPEDGQAWSENLQREMSSLSAEQYPSTVGNLDLLRNKAFVLRWENGSTVPLDQGFDLYVDIFLAGLEAQATARRAAGRA